MWEGATEKAVQDKQWRPLRHKGALRGGRGFTEAGERNGYKETGVSCGLEAPQAPVSHLVLHF